MSQSENWLGLIIGNSRLHWAWFIGEKLQRAWDSEHLPADAVQQLIQGCLTEIFPPELRVSSHPMPLCLASVVPSQTAIWQTYPQVQTVTLNSLPLQGAYSTLGIDRALALFGAGETWGWPILVIDAGTALTFTGADAERCLVGGAILPGIKLQFQSLAQKTAQLPLVDHQDSVLPERWALSTSEAIQSGIIYTVTAGIRDFITSWWQQFPGSGVALTGGDCSLVLSYLQSLAPELATRLIIDPHLMYMGMRCWRRRELREHS